MTEPLLSTQNPTWQNVTVILGAVRASVRCSLRPSPDITNVSCQKSTAASFPQEWPIRATCPRKDWQVWLSPQERSAANTYLTESPALPRWPLSGAMLRCHSCSRALCTVTPRSDFSGACDAQIPVSHNHPHSCFQH